jgi:hypothetical protein
VISPSKVGENRGSPFDRRSPLNRAATPWRPPPDPENGSPASVGTARGADRKADVLKEASAKYLNFSSLVQSESAAIVYVGQKLIGTIIKHDGRYEAFDAFGRCLGNFSKRADATRSISHGSVNNNTEAMNTALVR